jgi:hypothetical protein
MTSVTTATRLSVIFEKSMYALRMLELMGWVDSRISVIFMAAPLCRGCHAGGGARRRQEQRRQTAGFQCVLIRYDGANIGETSTAKEEVVLLTLYAKSKTDNITGAKLKEIRRVLES